MVTMLLAATLARAQETTDGGCESTRSGLIQQVYDEGEAERTSRSDSATSVLKRDEKRAKLMVKYHRKGWVCSPLEKWQAAWLMTQADDLETLELAYQLAIESMEGGEKRGPWLVAFTFDRKRTAGGYRQSYGSQTRVDGQGRRCLVEIEPDVSDADRAKYGHPPLADVYRRILDLNGFADDAPTLERVQRRGLYCPPEAQTRKAQRTVAPPPA